MAGYIGTKAVNLSTTAANVGNDADIGGDLTVDTSTLHVDSTNNRVGIGTSSPSNKLSIVGSGNGTSFSNTTTSTAYNLAQVVANAGGSVSIGVDNNIGTAFSAGNYGGLIKSTNNLAFQTDSTERMRIDASGRVTKPYQPAFVAKNAPSTFTNGVDIIWSATALNRGSVYNTSNGRFTAPVAGLYQFFASVRIENTGGTVTYHRISFKHNGSYVQSSRSQLSHRTATGYYSHAANDQAIYLNVNDYVNVTFEAGGGSSSFSTAAAGEHVFYGYLIG